MLSQIAPLDLQNVSQALRVRPRVLLLGQGYHAGPQGEDPLSDALRTRNSSARSAHEWWLREGGPLEKRVATFTEVERAVLVDDGLRACLRLPWTWVFTSAIESLPRVLLEIPNRRLVHQLTTPGSPRQSGDSVVLFRLFGAVDRASTAELPPVDAEALRRRRTQAGEILQGLAPMTSVRGHVFIDGWDPRSGCDWLRARELSTALAPLDVGQALLFGIDADRRSVLESDEDLAELLRLGVIQTFEPRLNDFLRLFAAQNQSITDDDWTTSSAESVLYKIAEKTPEKGAPPRLGLTRTVPIPVHEWRRMSATFTILEEIDLTRPLPINVEEQRHLFHTLCARGPEPSLRPWLPHIAFRRTALDQLLAQALRLCSTSTPQDHIIVVQGQSGAGKSVLLNLLAIELRHHGLPVLFATRALLPVDQVQVDEFCALLAQHEAITQPVFLIYDATCSDAEYLQLASFLSGRNRKCVVIGSAFPGQMRNRSIRRKGGSAEVHIVEVSIRLSQHETTDLLEHIQRFTGLAASVLRKLLGEDVSHFFAILYRLIPDARQHLSKGLIEEVVQGSERIMRRIEKERKGSSLKPEKVLAYKLRAALGVALQAIADAPRGGQTSETSVMAARQLVDTVMLISRLGLQIPQSIALRLIATDVAAYRSSMAEDIIVEHEPERDVITLSARHPLEADIWVQDRVHDRKRQFELLRAALLQIRESEARDDSIELEFVVKVLQAIGPEGPERFRLVQFYDQVAGIVSELRLRHEVHPRLLLAEAHTIREWIVAQQRQSDSKGAGEGSIIRLDTWLASLDKADEGLQRAIDMVKGTAQGVVSVAARRMLATLATERTAVIGFKLGSVRRLLSRGSHKNGSAAYDTKRWLGDARNAWHEALRFDDENYRALHAATWVIAERLDLLGEEKHEEAELLVEWGDIIDRYLDIDVPPSQVDNQDDAERKYAQRCGDIARFQAVMARSEARGSNALHVLVAREHRRHEGAAIARNYLETHCSNAILTERAVLLLYLRVWWESETGFDSFLGSERACLAFGEQQWAQLEQLTTARLRLEGEEDNAVTHFLRACALLHLRRVEDAAKAYDYVARLGLGGFRRSRSLMLLSDPTGKPRLLTAEFQGRRQGGICLAWCDELRVNIRFQPLEHDLSDPRPGTWLRPFHLALNFRGMYAEPTFRMRESRKE